jgi:hypothetical protein
VSGPCGSSGGNIDSFSSRKDRLRTQKHKRYRNPFDTTDRKSDVRDW